MVEESKEVLNEPGSGDHDAFFSLHLYALPDIWGRT